MKARRLCIAEFGVRCERCAKSETCENAWLPMGDGLERVWQMWLLCQTQMRYSFGGCAGLDYTACKVVFDIAGEEFDRYMLDAFGILERDLLEEMAKEAADGAAGKDGG